MLWFRAEFVVAKFQVKILKTGKKADAKTCDSGQDSVDKNCVFYP